ncbi:MAG TPA: formyltransferase family protein, partial [Thermomicrobiaceae bacterium]|nr:formyltransferase family protein [Thermomicrobiaceae bacterium]
MVELLSDLAPDLIVVSCFPWRLSAEILDIPRFGAINVHPSLLPRHRGPDPLFWTFRQGELQTGFSIHLVTEELDAGPMIAQMALPLDAPVEGVKVEQRLARMAASILPSIVRDLAGGGVVPKPQDEALSSYEGWPADSDLLMSTDWPVERVLRFVTGVPSLGY